MIDDVNLQRLAARLALMETLVSDLMLNTIPRSELERVRHLTVRKVREKSRVPPGATDEQIEFALEVQQELVAFAERFFDTLAQDMERRS